MQREDTLVVNHTTKETEMSITIDTTAANVKHVDEETLIQERRNYSSFASYMQSLQEQGYEHVVVTPKYSGRPFVYHIAHHMLDNVVTEA